MHDILDLISMLFAKEFSCFFNKALLMFHKKVLLTILDTGIA